MTRNRSNLAAVLFEGLESRRLMSAGTLDNSFGVHGVLARPETTPTGPIAVQSDGKMLVADITQIRRLRAGGGADPTYATNGLATVPLAIKAIAVQNDGKAVIAGLVTEASDSSDTNYHLVVARLTISGKLDRTFGRNGLFTLPANTGSEALTISMRANKIAIGGVTAGVEPILVVLNLDGTADTTFSKDGLLQLGTDESVTALSIAKNGSISTLLPIVGGSGFRTARVTASGAFDVTYSGDGISPLFKSIEAPSGLMNGDGSVLVAGLDQSQHAVLTRITNRGTLDQSFGQAGLQTLSNRTDLFPAAITQSPNGNRYLYGHAGALTALDAQHIFVAKLTTGNLLDTSFGTQGLLTISPHVDDDAFAAAFTPQGDKLILAAGAYSKHHLSGFSSELMRILL